MFAVDGKRHFDSFRRTTPITFSVPAREKQPIQSTVAQLLWGKWMFENRIMSFIKENWPAVKKDMAVTLKRQRSRKKTGVCRPKKRQKCVSHQVHTKNVRLGWY